MVLSKLICVLPTLCTGLRPTAGALTLANNEGLDNKLTLPLCKRNNPASLHPDVKPYRYIIAADSTGLKYFQIDEEGGMSNDPGKAKPLIEGSKYVPYGWAHSIAVCCNLLYVSLLPPTEDITEAASDCSASADAGAGSANVDPGFKQPRVLQFVLAGTENALAVLDQPPQVVVNNTAASAITCDKDNGDLYIAKLSNSAESQVLHVTGEELLKLSEGYLWQTGIQIESLYSKPNFIIQGLSADGKELFLALRKSTSSGARIIEKLNIEKKEAKIISELLDEEDAGGAANAAATVAVGGSEDKEAEMPPSDFTGLCDDARSVFFATSDSLYATHKYKLNAELDKKKAEEAAAALAAEKAAADAKAAGGTAPVVPTDAQVEITAEEIEKLSLTPTTIFKGTLSNAAQCATNGETTAYIVDTGTNSIKEVTFGDGTGEYSERTVIERNLIAPVAVQYLTHWSSPEHSYSYEIWGKVTQWLGR